MVSLHILNCFFISILMDRTQNIVCQKTYSLAVVIDHNPSEDYVALERSINELAAKVFPGGRLLTDEYESISVRISVTSARSIRKDTDNTSALKRVNPLHVTNKQVCETLVNNSIAVILYGTLANQREQERLGLSNYITNYVSTVSYALGFYQIPVISVSTKNVEFSDKSTYPSFLRTLPPVSEQADVWISLLRQLDFNQVIIIYSEHSNTEALISRFQLQADQWKIEVQAYVRLQVGFSSANASYQMQTLLEHTTSNIYLLACTTEEAALVLPVAEAMNLTTAGHAWIVTEAVLDAIQLPAGAIGMRLVRNDSRAVEAALTTVRRGFGAYVRRLRSQGAPATAVIAPPVGCSSGGAQTTEAQTSHLPWLTNRIGQTFYRELTSTKFTLPTAPWGRYSYTNEGDRLLSRYEIINAPNDQPVGYYRQRSGKMAAEQLLYIDLNEDKIIWPGETLTKPFEITLPTHLTVLTVKDPPFTFSFPAINNNTNCTNYRELYEAYEGFLPDLSQQETSSEPSTEKGDTILDFLTPPIHQDTNNKHMYPEWHSCTVMANTAESFCCTGYAINLLQKLSTGNLTRFTFDLIVEQVYGGRILTTDAVSWNGMIGSLVSRNADMAIGALSINEEREQVVDFSKPWLYHGITLLERKQPRMSPMRSFLMPFKASLWASLFTSVMCVGVALYVLDRRSPMRKFFMRNDAVDSISEDENVNAISSPHHARNDTMMTVVERAEKPKLSRHTSSSSAPGHKASTVSGEQPKMFDAGAMDENEPLSLSGALWFVWGVLLDSGIGEKTPRSFSGRVLGVVWCGFSMIMVASYTANLAAFLVLDQPKQHLSGITDTRLRNPSANFTYATVQDSNVHTHFKRSAELSTMFRKMETMKKYTTAEEAIADVQDGKLDAFIWDSTRLDYAISNNCTLRTSGQTFGRSSYAVGLQKNSPWTRFITLSIVQLTEEGVMESLDAMWIGVRKCMSKSSDSPVRLSLMNMKDVFILVGVGILIGCFLSFTEVKWRRRALAKERRDQSANNYAKVWLRLRQPSDEEGGDSGEGTTKTRPNTIHTQMIHRPSHDALFAQPYRQPISERKKTPERRQRTPSTEFGFVKVADSNEERRPLTQAVLLQRSSEHRAEALI